MGPAPKEDVPAEEVESVTDPAVVPPRRPVPVSAGKRRPLILRQRDAPAVRKMALPMSSSTAFAVNVPDGRQPWQPCECAF